MEAIDPELCRKITADWYRTSKRSETASESTHATLNRLVRGERRICKFFTLNLTNVAEALFLLDCNYVLPPKHSRYTFDEAVALLKKDASAGYPYFSSKAQALEKDYEKILGQTMAIVSDVDISSELFGWVVKKVEVLAANKKPEFGAQGEESYFFPGKERNVVVSPLAVVLAFNMLVGRAIDHSIEMWLHTTTKVGAGKVDLPFILDALHESGYVYTSLDISGMEMNLAPAWYEVAAVLRSHQSGLPLPFWRRFYKRYVTGQSVVCPCGNVYDLEGCNRSGFPDTIGSNSETTKALLCLLSKAVQGGHKPDCETVFTIQEWLDHAKSLRMAVVGDDAVLGVAGCYEQLLYQTVREADRYSSLQLKMETPPSGVTQQVFLSTRFDWELGRTKTVRPEKILAGLYYTPHPPSVAAQALASAYLDLADTEHRAFMEQLMARCRSRGWPVQFVDKRSADIVNTPSRSIAAVRERIRPQSAVLKSYQEPHKVASEQMPPKKEVKKQAKAAAKAEVKYLKKAKKPTKKRREKKIRSVGRTHARGGPYKGKESLDARAAQLATVSSTQEYMNAEMWAQALRDPFGKGIGVRLPDSSSMLPTYAFPMVLRGTLPVANPAATPTQAEAALQVFPDPYYGAVWLTGEANTGDWTTCTATGQPAGQPTNLSTLTGQASLYRVVSMGVRVYSDASIQSRGGSWWALNNLANQFYTGGGGGFTGVTPAILNSAQQVLKGDLAALGGDGLRFNWLPLTDRSDFIGLNSTGRFGFTAQSWRAPTYTTNIAGTMPSNIEDAALFLRFLSTNTATTTVSLQYEIVWNVEAIMLAASDMTYPGKVIAGSASAVTNVVVEMEAAGTKVIGEQVSVPGAEGTAPPERGGAPHGTTKPVSITEAVTNTLTSELSGGGQLGKLVGMGMDLVSGLALSKHKVAVYAGYPECSPVWRAAHAHYYFGCRPQKRPLSFTDLPEADLPMTDWLEWFNAEIRVVDEVRQRFKGALVGNYHSHHPSATPARKLQDTEQKAVGGAEDSKSDATGDGVFLDDGTTLPDKGSDLRESTVLRAIAGVIARKNLTGAAKHTQDS